MSQSFHLFQLQKIDQQLDEARKRLAEIDAILGGDRSIQLARQLLEQKELAYKKARQQLHLVEDAVMQKRIKLEQSESMLYSGKVKNPKELQDLQLEVASLKRAISALEDQELEAMIASESAEGEQALSAGALKQAEGTFIENNARLTGEGESLKHKVERLESERTAMLSQVQPVNVQTYDRIRKQKRGLAVTNVLDDACGACGAELAPAERQAARSPNLMVFCPSCGRILYSG